MEMLPPATSVVVGATIEKRFPGYGVHRGTVAEIDGGKVVVHWATTNERTTLSLNPVVDGQLVPRARKASGHGAEYLSGRRRGRRAVNYVDPEPDDDDEDLELGPPDDGDGWD